VELGWEMTSAFGILAGLQGVHLDLRSGFGAAARIREPMGRGGTAGVHLSLGSFLWLGSARDDVVFDVWVSGEL
jgi:hypothetical protein